MKKPTAKQALVKYYATHRITRDEFLSIAKLQLALQQKLAEVSRVLEVISVPCPGEAHGNAFIDNCMICAPLWGSVLSADFDSDEPESGPKDAK